MTLRIRVESVGADPATIKTLSGETAIAPKSGRQLALWLAAPPPRTMGMTAGPALAVAGLEPEILPLTASKGSVNPARITSVRFGISRPTVPRMLAVGPLQVEPPSRAETSAYNGIVDSFGQYRPGSLARKSQFGCDAARQRCRGSCNFGKMAYGLAKSRPFWRAARRRPVHCDRLFSNRAAPRQMVARHARWQRILLDRHGCRPAVGSDFCRGARVYVS